MRSLIIYLALLLTTITAQAQDIRFSRDELQQNIASHMPYSQQQSILLLTVSQPDLALVESEQRIKIRAHLQVSTVIGGVGQGWVTLDGKLRYRSEDYSFYIDDLRIIDLDIAGLSPEFKPQVTRFTQDLVAPLITEHPVYTLQDNSMQESLAKMMLRSIAIEDNHVVASLGVF